MYVRLYTWNQHEENVGNDTQKEDDDDDQNDEGTPQVPKLPVC